MRTPGMTVVLWPNQTSLPTTVSPLEGRPVSRSKCSAQEPPMMGKGNVEGPSMRWLAPFMMNRTPVPSAQNFPMTSRSGP
ncbi:hypothetical protein SAVIM40S_02289 [Streptomyces avidinii]